MRIIYIIRFTHVLLYTLVPVMLLGQGNDSADNIGTQKVLKDNVTQEQYLDYKVLKQKSKVNEHDKLNVKQLEKELYKDKAVFEDEAEKYYAPASAKALGIDKSEYSFQQASVSTIIADDENETNNRIITGANQYDSRVEIKELSKAIQWQNSARLNAQSVGLVIEKEYLHPVTDSIYQLDVSVTLGSRFNLCENESFVNQPSVGVGTAFLIDSITMLSASHAFIRPVTDYVVVFGYKILNANSVFESWIHVDNIFHPKAIQMQSMDLDVVAILLDKPTDRIPIKLSTSATRATDHPVYMIGYPSGLPEKAAFNARIADNTHQQHFYTTLDAFQGNSGSPVFDLKTHEAIGILVSGEIDYKYNGICNESNSCRLPYCMGEKVMRIEKVLEQRNQAVH